MDAGGHKLLDILEHIWPYVTALFLTVIGMIKLWWSDRRATLSRLRNVEVTAKKAVTHEQLHECRTDVAEEDHLILSEIRAIRMDMREDNKANAREHQQILKVILNLHKNE